MLGRRKSLEEANPIIRQLREEKAAREKANEESIQREKQEKTTMFGVGQLTKLLDSIEGKQAYQRRGAQAINKDLVKWGNQVLSSGSPQKSPATTASPARSPMMWDTRGGDHEHKQHVRSIVESVGITTKKAEIVKQCQQTKTIRTVFDDFPAPPVRCDHAEADDESTDEAWSRSVSLPVIRAVDRATRKYIRQMPRLSHYELDLVSKIERKYLAENFENDAVAKHMKDSLYANLSPVARHFPKPQQGASTPVLSPKVKPPQSPSLRALPTLQLPEKKVRNWLDADASPLKQSSTPEYDIYGNRNRRKKRPAGNQSPHVLRAKLEDAKQREKSSKTSLDMRIHTLQRSLPADLIMKHLGPQGVASRIVQIVEDALSRVLRKKLQMVWTKWTEVYQMLQTQYRNRCAITIEKLARGMLARRLARVKRHERDKYLSEQAERERRWNEKRERASIQIQSHVRRFLCQSKYHSTLHLHRAAIKIQRQYRVFRARQGVLVTIMGRRVRLQAAIKIQRVARGHFGRRRASMFRKIKTVDRHRHWLLERAAHFERRFQREGAAIKIQEWWDGHLLKLRARAFVKLTRYRSALHIERVYRGHRGRLVARELRHEKILRDRRLHNAAATIQRNVRTYLGRKRMQLLLEAKRLAFEQRTIENRKLRENKKKGFGNAMQRNTLWFKNKTLNAVNGTREVQAALTIQRAYRGMRARKTYLKSQLLALKRRRHRAQRDLEVHYATRIQAMWRGKLQREKVFKLRTAAARRVQGAVRAYIARRGFKVMLNARRQLELGAVIYLQRCWRGSRDRRNFVARIVDMRIKLPSSLCCQRLWRGYVGRKRFYQTLENTKRLMESRILGRNHYNQLYTAFLNHELVSRLNDRLENSGLHTWSSSKVRATRSSARRGGTNSSPPHKARAKRSTMFGPGSEGNGAAMAARERSLSPDDKSKNLGPKRGKRHTTHLGNTPKQTFVSTVMYEVEHAFLAFCNPTKPLPLDTRDKELQRELTSGSLFKNMCRASGLDKELPQSDLDMLYAKFKDKHSKGLDLYHFCMFLVAAANKIVSPGDAVACETMRRLNHPGNGLPHNVAINQKKGMKETTLAAESYRKLPRWLQGYKDNEAKALVVFKQYVLCADPVAIVGMSALRDRVTRMLTRFAIRIQNRMRGVYGREMAANAKQQKQQLEQMRLQNAKAVLIQTHVFRPVLARRKSQRAAATTYIQYTPWDGDIMKRSWYNPRSVQSFSFRPGMLTQDLRNTRKKKDGTTSTYKRHACRVSILPKLSRMFHIECVTCNTTATQFCHTCSEVFCEHCASAMHHRGKRVHHNITDIPQCEECPRWIRPPPYEKPQAATLKLNGGNFDGLSLCDECFYNIVANVEEGGVIHRLVATCRSCNKFVARWECGECGNDLYCNDCYALAHNSGQRQLHRSTPLLYYPTSMLRSDKHEREHLKTKEAMDKRMGELMEKNTRILQTRAIRKIQRAFRFYLAQKMFKSKRSAIARARHAKFIQRKKDDVIRRSCGFRLKRVFGAQPELPSDEIAIPKTLWRKLLLAANLVGSSSMGKHALYAEGTKIEITRRRHPFYRGQGVVMTRPLHKKKPFRVFLTDASKTIEVTLKDIKIPRGVQDRMERAHVYESSLARERNQDWFGLPIKDKFPLLKRSRYKIQRSITRRSVRGELKRFDALAADNKLALDYSDRINIESRLYNAPVKTRFWDVWLKKRAALRVVGEWEWLHDMATGRRYWLNVATNVRREHKPSEFVTWKDHLWYATSFRVMELFKTFTIEDYEMKEIDWYTVKKEQKTLTPEQIALQEAAKWVEHFDEDTSRPYWTRTVVVQKDPNALDYDSDDDEVKTRDETVWEKPLELMDPEDRKNAILEQNKKRQQEAADKILKEEQALQQAARLRELERKKRKSGGGRGRGRGR
jgi:hypothetical protein